MRTITKALLVLVGLAAFAFPAAILAQAPVLVTATVTGTNLAPYASGTYQVQLVDASGTQIPSTGLPTQYAGSLSATGALSVTLNPNSAFVSGSQWKFSICSQIPNSSLPITVQAQKCFSQAVTIANAGDISAALSTSAPALYYFNPVTGALYSTSGGSGSGTVSGQAANVVGKATNATTTGAQSSISDNGTAVAVGEPVTITENTSPFLGLTIDSCGSGSLPTFGQNPNLLINCTSTSSNWGGIDILSGQGSGGAGPYGQSFITFGDNINEINSEIRGYNNGANSGMGIFARGSISLNVGTQQAAQASVTSASATFTVPVLMPTGSTAVTPAPGDNTTKVATTAFVLANAGSGSFTALSGDATSTSTGGATSVVKVNGGSIPASASGGGRRCPPRLLPVIPTW